MVERLHTGGYTGAAAWATSATPLPMWGVEDYRWYLFHVTHILLLARARVRYAPELECD